MKSLKYSSLLLVASTLIVSPLSLLSAQSKVKENKKRPNILFLLTDDQSYNTIGALGNKTVVTPNMDYLVKHGTSFSQNHVMGGMGGAISMPSRAMLMTGLYLNKLHQDGTIISEDQKTFPELFRENGYTTFATGKWHSDKASFNRSFSTGDNIFLGGMVSYASNGHFRPFLHAYDSSGKYNDGYYREEFSSVCYANAAINFLKNERDKKSPFLMYVAFNSPHDPRTPPPAYGHKYQEKDIDLPLNFMIQHPFDNGDLEVRDEVFLPTPRDPDAIKGEIAAYYGMISEVDSQIGRIIAALKESGEYDNTIIVFTADNGLAVGQHGLLGKQNLYEHSVKIPLVMVGPNIPQNQKNDAYSYLLDLYPTLCEMTNIPTPSHIDGRSLNEAIVKQEPLGRDHLLLSYINIQRAIKADDYKLIMYNVKGQRRIQLFDLKNDPYECDNLADAPAYKEKVEELSKQLGKAMINYQDICNPALDDWGYPERIEWATIVKMKP